LPQVFPIGERLAVLDQGQVDVDVAENLRHGPAVAIRGLNLQRDRPADG
jgi:hypothetical protein